MRMNLKDDIIYPTRDASWLMKCVVGGMSNLVVLGGPAVIGYSVSIIRQTANGEDNVLPEYDNYWDLWKDGLKASTSIFLPGFICTVFAVLSAGLGLYGYIYDEPGFTGSGCVGLAFAVLGIFIASAFYPAMLLQYAMTGEMWSVLDISALWSHIRQGLSDYLAIFAVSFGLGIAGGVVGLLLSGAFFGLGFFILYPLGALLMYIQARMIGSYYRFYFM